MLERLRPLPTAAAVLLAGLAVTAALTLAQADENRRVLAERFGHSARVLLADIDRGAFAIVRGMRGVRGFFIGAGPDGFSQASYQRFLGSRDLANEFPGFGAVGFQRRVAAAELPAFLAAARRDLGPDYAVRPAPAGQAEHYVVRAVADPVKYRAALGLDSLTDPVRAEALLRAVRSGAVVGSAPMDGKDPRLGQAGRVAQVVYLAHYRDGAELRTEADRQAAAVGVLSAVVTMEPVVTKALQSQPGLALGIRDLAAPDSSAVVRPLPALPADDRLPGLTRTLRVFERDWRFEVRATPEWLAVQDQPPPALTALAGLLASSLLALLAFLALAHRGRAAVEAAARRSSSELETARRDNQALLDTLHTHALVSVADAQGRITDVNEAFCALSGYRRDELVGNDHRIVNSGTHPPAFWAAMWAQVNAGRAWRGQVCNRSKSGALYWVDSVIAPFLDERGQVLRYISIRHDITALKEVQQRILASEARFRALAESAPVGVFATDAEGLCTYTNPAWQAIYGMSPTQGLGQGWAEHVHPDDRQALVEAWTASARDGGLFDERFRVCRPDGSTVRVHALAQPVRVGTAAASATAQAASEQRISAYVGTVQDVTALHEAGQALQDARAAAEAANRAKSAFLANMSHEIRTPLNAIIGLNYLLAQRSLAGEERELVAGMSTASQTLLAIISDVLDISKIESGELQLEQRPFQPAAVLARTVAMLQAQADGKGLVLRLHTAEAAALPVVGDATRFGQIATNLLANALKFTPRGAVTVRLEARAEDERHQRLTLSVADTGIGMGAAVRAALFQPFMQADASVSRRFGGTGLGLSIVAELVQMMGGAIGVDSSEGQGSVFTVTLSLPLASAAGLAVADELLSSDGAEPLQVVVAEDDAEQRSRLLALAAELGWVAEGVDSGEALVDAVMRRSAAGQRTHALVVDWRLPGIDGLRALAELRRRLLAAGGQAAMPAAVVVSAHELAALRSAPEAGQAANFLVKPFDRSGLFNAVADALSTDPLLSQRLLPAPSALSSEVAWLPGVRLLVADDSELNLDVARRILEHEGAQVLCCNSAEQALQRLRSDPASIDAVLMDLQMPGMDGFDATRHIRGELGLDRLPVIALTAGALTSERRRALAAGMNEFLAKPLVPHQLVRSLRQQIAQAQGRALPIRSRLAEAGPVDADWPELAGIDRVDVSRRLHGDAALFRDMLRRLLAEFSDLADAQRAAALDARALAARVHKLAGSASIVGARGIEALAAELEQQLRAGGDDAPATQDRVQRLARALQDLAAAARPQLEALQAAAADVGADAASPLRAVDADELRAALASLVELLDLHDLEAVTRYRALAPALARHLPADTAQALAQAMDHYDFTAATTLLRQAGPR